MKNEKRYLIHRLVALGFMVMFLSTTVKGVYQVYFAELAVHFGQGRTGFAWSGSVFMLVTGLVSPLVGALSDRVGPLRTVVLGAVAEGVSLWGATVFSGSLWVFVAAYGLGGAFALAAMTYVPMGVLVDRLFQQRNKGFALALVGNGTAIGFIVLSPLWIALQPRLPWTQAFAAVGLLLAGPVALAAAWGARALRRAGLAQPAAEPGPAVAVWRQVRSDPGFYVLALGFMGCGATMAFVDVHLVAFWQDAGAPRERMGLSLSLLGVLELVSGLATGWLALRWRKHALLAVFYALRSLAMALLLAGGPDVQTLGFAAVFGASYLGTVVLTSMYCFERYGTAIKGRVFGLLFLMHQCGAFAAVQLGAWSFDLTGSGRSLAVALAALTALGGVASFFGLRDGERPPAPGADPAPALAPAAGRATGAS
ncbi:MFS transporter [Azohydromonas lata]|uniref:MFS transporter n=1 Tax=Azohydromonas lata TaxID=45677 RepID=A0ABU5IEW0_9BURK|nr:MFS transporter [Azohydromonas lata]MDZ5457666.1 MFS transporter [Azohydromonas lata]